MKYRTTDIKNKFINTNVYNILKKTKLKFKEKIIINNLKK